MLYSSRCKLDQQIFILLRPGASEKLACLSVCGDRSEKIPKTAALSQPEVGKPPAQWWLWRELCRTRDFLRSFTELLISCFPIMALQSHTHTKRAIPHRSQSSSNDKTDYRAMTCSATNIGYISQYRYQTDFKTDQTEHYHLLFITNPSAQTPPAKSTIESGNRISQFYKYPPSSSLIHTLPHPGPCHPQPITSWIKKGWILAKTFLKCVCLWTEVIYMGAVYC